MSRGRSLPLVLLGLIVPAALAGCPTGDGEGVVVGSFHIVDCDGRDDYGSVDQPAIYDMRANFFVGEPLLDEQGLRHRLDLRLQRGGNNVEDVDSLYVQINDVGAVARDFAAWSGTPVHATSVIRAALQLYVTCPGFFGRLEATVHPGQQACPTLDASTLADLCASMDYNASLDPALDFPPFAVGHSCLVFCRFGQAERGAEVPEDFRVDFGDTVQGLFSLTLAEQRLQQSGVEVCADGYDNDADGQIDESECETSNGFGFIRGTFNFEIRRGQVAQEFP